MGVRRDIQGRFLPPDPYDGSYDASNPQSMNRYVYALNNPLSNVDPTGRDACIYDDGDGGVTIYNEGGNATCPGNGVFVPTSQYVTNAYFDPASGNLAAYESDSNPSVVNVYAFNGNDSILILQAGVAVSLPLMGSPASGSGGSGAPGNGPPPPSDASCTQEANSAAAVMGDVKPSKGDVITAGAGVLLGGAIATAPDDGPLAPAVYKGAVVVATGAVGLLKDVVIRGTAKAAIWGLTYSTCMNPNHPYMPGFVVP